MGRWWVPRATLLGLVAVLSTALVVALPSVASADAGTAPGTAQSTTDPGLEEPAASTDPAPTEPASDPPGSAQSAPAEPAPVEPAPTEPTSTEPAPPEPAPGEVLPTETVAPDPVNPQPEPAPSEAPEQASTMSTPVQVPAAPVPADPAPAAAATATPTSTPTAVDGGDRPRVHRARTVAARAAGTWPQRRKAAPQDKVTICHRTNTSTNPYNQIVVSESAAVSGHAGHKGPVFAPGVDDWGDIIPPIPPELPDGLNWPVGRAILANGCEAPPDPGPMPGASIGNLVCAPEAGLVIRVANDPRATAPATFAILVNGVVVQRVGPVPPGQAQVVDIGPALAPFEDQTVVIEVRSGGQVLASRVVTVDCVANPPDVHVAARLFCVGQVPRGVVRVTNNGTSRVTVTATVDGAPVGTPVVVEPGQSARGVADLSAYEDRTVTAQVLVDDVPVATYTIAPDCVRAQPDPEVRVSGLTCPLTTATMTLTNAGDPESRVVFVIRVDGRIAQVSAPLYGGESTTIVGDLSRFEDQTVTVEVRANGRSLGSRTFTVDCQSPGPAPGPGPGPGPAPGPGPGPAPGPAPGGGGTGGSAPGIAGTSAGSDVPVPPAEAQPGGASTGTPLAPAPGSLPQVGAEVGPGLLALAAGLVLLGMLLIGLARRPGRSASRQGVV